MPGRVAHGTFAHDLGRRHPFEVAMLVSAAVVGASRVLAEPTSGSLERAFPPLLLTAWYGLIAFGAIVALVGVSLKDWTTGLLVERAGLWPISFACLVYGGTLSITGGLRGVAAATFVFGFALASFLRILDIGRILSSIRAIAEAQRAVFDEGD